MQSVDERTLTGARLTGRSSASWVERGIESLLFACGLLSIVTTVGILFILGGEAIDFFREVSFAQFFLDSQWTPLFADKHFGIWPLLSGTILTAGIATLVAVPFGLTAAVYLSEFATARIRATVKPALEVLAGIPTIVYGYFALIFLTPMLQMVVPDLAGFNALSPGLIMGIMIMPMISSLAEDALHAVPRTLRESSLALGATRLTTALRVTLPAAGSGIVAATILAISRAVGETMIVAIAAGQQPRLTMDPRVPVQTLTTYIVQISMGDTPAGTLEYRTIFAAGVSLFVLTFAMNLISQRVSRRLRRA